MILTITDSKRTISEIINTILKLQQLPVSTCQLDRIYLIQQAMGPFKYRKMILSMTTGVTSIQMKSQIKLGSWQRSVKKEIF